jgi:L-iditol 2-dehydrogenase
MATRAQPTVRAALMTKPAQIDIVEVEKPHLPEDSFLLKVDQVGLCGSDRHAYLGHMAVPFPILFGHEIAGHVAELGPMANDSMIIIGGPVQEGDAVVVVPSSEPCHRCSTCLHFPHRPTLCPNRTVHGFMPFAGPEDLRGGCAEYMLVRAHSWVYRPSDDVPPIRHVLAEPAAVATRAVERAMLVGMPNIGEGCGLGKTAVVQGAGPIGLLIVAVLRFTGVGQIIVTDLLDSRLAIAGRLGADVALNVARTSVEERTATVEELTDGLGADIVFEAAGVPVAFAEALALVRRGGRVIELGHYTDPGPVEIHPHAICYKDLDVLGVWAYPQIQFETALRFLANCDLPLERLITHRLPLDDVQEGLRMLGQDGVLKVVVEP